MGLFGKKKDVTSELDIPPAPPPVKVTKEVVSAPATPEPPRPEFPTLPEIPPPPGKELPTFEEGLMEEEIAPPISKTIEGLMPPPPPGVAGIPPPPIAAVPGPEAPEAPPQMPSFEAVEEQISEEEKAGVVRLAKGPIFIRADNYKNILEELNIARNLAKEAGVMIAGIGDLSLGSEQECENWRLCLEDIERKTLYVDKSLFGKG